MRAACKCGKPLPSWRNTSRTRLCDDCTLAAARHLDACYASLPPARTAWELPLVLTIEVDHDGPPTLPERVAALRDILDQAPDFLTLAEPTRLDVPDEVGELRRAALDHMGRP